MRIDMETTQNSFDEETRGIMPDEQVLRLHLLRHGEVEAMTERIVRGQLDHELSATGIEQSQALADWIEACVPDVSELWSSDLKRCRVLAEKIASRTSCDVQFEPRLREQDMGAWQGKTWQEITRADGAAVTAYWDNYVDACPTSGESYRQLHDRVGAWWQDVSQALQDKTVVVVTHVGVLRSLQCHLLGIPAEEALRFAPDVASHTSFLVSEAGAVQTSFGERPWLSRVTR